MGILRHHHIAHRLSRHHHGRKGKGNKHGQHGIHRPKISHHPRPGHRHVHQAGPVTRMVGGIMAILAVIAAKLGVKV